MFSKDEALIVDTAAQLTLCEALFGENGQIFMLSIPAAPANAIPEHMACLVHNLPTVGEAVVHLKVDQGP